MARIQLSDGDEKRVRMGGRNDSTNLVGLAYYSYESRKTGILRHWRTKTEHVANVQHNICRNPPPLPKKKDELDSKISQKSFEGVSARTD